jgi:hypothetical protein
MTAKVRAIAVDVALRGVSIKQHCARRAGEKQRQGCRLGIFPHEQPGSPRVDVSV